MRIKNRLTTFSDFSYEDLPITEQEFEDFKSKYLDIYDEVKGQTPRVKQVSVLDDIDFEVLLIHRDEINVGYILQLIGSMTGADPIFIEQKREQIAKLLSSQPQLRSKKGLIEQFIEENRIRLADPDFQVQNAFEVFWDEQRQNALHALCRDEALRKESIQEIIDEYLFSNEVINLSDKLRKALTKNQKFLEQQKTIKRLKDKVRKFIDTFLRDSAA